VQQRRFCSWGVLPDVYLAGLAATSGGSVPLPPPGSLSCPTTCQPPTCIWPLRLPFAPNATAAGPSGPAWLVLDQRAANITLPAGDAAGDAAWTFQADGGFGWYRVRHGRGHRARLRAAAARLQLPAGECDGAGVGGGSGPAGPAGPSPQLLPLLTLAAALGDQVAVGLSVFGGGLGGEAGGDADQIAGGELLDVVAAAAGSLAAADGGCGSYALLLPVLEALEVLGDRVASNLTCWQQLQVGGARWVGGVGGMACRRGTL